MDEVNASRQKLALNKLPIALIGSLAIIVLIEGHIARTAHSFASDRLLEWSAFREISTKKASESQILCFGDSHIKVGVLPKIIESRTGLSAYNFALGYGQAPSSYYMLKNAIADGAKPQFALVDFKWTSLKYPPQMNQSFYPALLSYPDTVELGLKAQDSEFLGQMFLGKILPSFRARNDLRKQVVSSLNGNGNDRRRENYAWRATWETNNGTCLAPVNPFYKNTINMNHAEFFVKDWACAPLNHEYVTKFFELANEHDITVFWVLTPINSQAQAELARIGVDDKYMTWVREMHARFPRVVIIDARQSNYPEDQFVDMTHLNRNGAETFSAGLGDIIRKHMANNNETPERYATLPRYRRFESGMAIRDVTQFRDIMKTANDTRRR